VHLGIATEIDVAGSLSWMTRTPNTPESRRRAFESAVAEAVAAVDAGDARPATNAVKAALEAVHELDDSRRRGEWSDAAWTPGESGLWQAHLAARHAAHHQSAYVVHLVGGGAHTRSRDDLRWEGTLPPIDSQALASEYASRLAGRPVLRWLASLRALLARTIP
jgi:hypothetical protein